MNGAPSRVYVRLPNWVGDVVLSTPLLRAVREAFSKAEIVLHGKARNFELLEGAGFHDRQVSLEKGGPLLGPWREGRRVAREAGPFDLALVLPNSFSSAVVARATGATRRVGYKLNARGVLLTDAIPVKKDGRLRLVPMVDYYLGLLAPLGVTPAVPRRPVLAITGAARARARAFLERLGVKDGDRLWAVNAGAAWETKRWLPGYVGKLADLAAERGARVLALGGPGEEEIYRAAQAAATTRFLGLGEVVPLADLCAVLERCELLVTTDSGPRHFGVAAGIPIVAIVGSTHPAYTEVDHAPQEVCCEKVDCWPCHLKKCPVDFRCMTRLGPEKVIQACDRVLAARGAAGARP